MLYMQSLVMSESANGNKTAQIHLINKIGVSLNNPSMRTLSWIQANSKPINDIRTIKHNVTSCASQTKASQSNLETPFTEDSAKLLKQGQVTIGQKLYDKISRNYNTGSASDKDKALIIMFQILARHQLITVAQVAHQLYNHEIYVTKSSTK